MRILPIEYWMLLFIYVNSVRSLYEPISRSELDTIKEMIEFHYNNLEEYSNATANRYSTQSRLHLVDQVIQHVPLHCHSQFVFEGTLFNLKNGLICGTESILDQVVQKTFLFSTEGDSQREMFKKASYREHNYQMMIYLYLYGICLPSLDPLCSTRCKINGHFYQSMN
jgi:hypothetical protein